MPELQRGCLLGFGIAAGIFLFLISCALLSMC